MNRQMRVGPFVSNLLLFGRCLRRGGVEVHHSRLIDAIPALETIGVRHRRDVHATLRALLVHRHEDLARFDAVFDTFFRARVTPGSRLAMAGQDEPPGEAAKPRAGGPGSAHMAGGERDVSHEASLAVGAYSETGVSRTKDFGDFTSAELEEARRLMMRLPWRLGARSTRRWERAAGAAIDLRPVLRQSVMRGEVLDLPRRRRRVAPRPIVLIGDVSGSMERYSRVLVSFVYGLAKGARHVESFVFSTALTRITHAVARHDAACDLTRVIRDVRDWGGGTRIGEALRTFNTRWARRVMRHGPVVLIVSDGWDRGDPDVLARELARVRRGCRRVIWLNPLLGSAGYEPLTRGMQTALRYVDDFLPAHNLASLDALAHHLHALPPARQTPPHRATTR